MLTARKFVNDVSKLANKYNANYFIVTDGASGTSNGNGYSNPAVKNARDNQIEWEKNHGFDPYEDWSNTMDESVLNEVYFGKTPELLAIEKQLGKFRSKYLRRYILNTFINSDPDLLKYNRMMGEFFGFGVFTLTIINQYIANAFTYPISFRIDAIDTSNNLVVDKSGYKFKKEADYACQVGVYAGLIFNPDVTDEEAMAIILHEVGHNFSSCISHPQGIFNKIYVSCAIGLSLMIAPFSLLLYLLECNSITTEIDKINAKWRKDGIFITSIIDIVNQMKDLISNGGNFLSDIIRVTIPGVGYLNNAIRRVIRVITSPLTLLMLPIRYRDERIADNFATIYGYGAASASIDAKFDDKPAENGSIIIRNLNKVPVLSQLFHLLELPSIILITAFDEHPVGYSRGVDQLNLLKRELRKADLDPNLKKTIAADINSCEKVIADCKSTKNGLKDPYLCRKVYNKILSATNGTLKELLIDNSERRFQDYDNSFESRVGIK